MIRALFNIIGCLLFALLIWVCALCFFSNMSFKQATSYVTNKITSFVSSSAKKVDVPEHLSHTPSRAADAQLKRISDKLR